MNLKFAIFCFFGFVHLCRGEKNFNGGSGKPLINRPLHHQSSSPCYAGYDDHDAVDEDRSGKTLLLAAAGGAALGYHLAMQNHKQPIINNNIFNEYPPPCIIQGGGLGGGILGSVGGGIVNGLLSNHPILSNIVQGGLLGGGGGALNNALANRQTGVNWNRAIRQFNRFVRPIIRGFR